MNKEDVDVVVKARRFAVGAHGVQKYGDLPYVTHLTEVMSVLIGHGYVDAPHLATALLHDVLEDTKTTHREIEIEFGALVADAVAFCTDEHGETRKERKTKTYARVQAVVDAHDWALEIESNVPVSALLVGMRCKLADRVANLRASFRAGQSDLLLMYARETPVFCTTYRFRFDRGCDGMLAEHHRLIEAVNARN